MKLHERVLEYIRFCVSSRKSAFIGAFVAPETVDPIHNGIIDMVAEMEGWLQPVNYNYATFKIAHQTLFFRFGITLEVPLRPTVSTDRQYLEQDVEKYTKLFFEWQPSKSNVEDGY